MVFLVAGTTLLALGQSIQVHQISNFVLKDWQSDPWYMITLIYNVAALFIVTLLLCLHYFYWQPFIYLKEQAMSYGFQRKFWRNEKCEKDFRKEYK
jgi:hypothetical protein